MICTIENVGCCCLDSVNEKMAQEIGPAAECHAVEYGKERMQWFENRAGFAATAIIVPLSSTAGCGGHDAGRWYLLCFYYNIVKKYCMICWHQAAWSPWIPA